MGILGTPLSHDRYQAQVAPPSSNDAPRVKALDLGLL